MAVFRSVSSCRENTPVNAASTMMSSVCISQSVTYVINKAGICGNTEYPVGAGYGVSMSEPTLSSAPHC